MLDFLKHNSEYEYATKDGRHLAASLVCRVLEAAIAAPIALMVGLAVVKLLCVLGVIS